MRGAFKAATHFGRVQRGEAIFSSSTDSLPAAGKP
jgi:hypothetical protein